MQLFNRFLFTTEHMKIILFWMGVAGEIGIIKRDITFSGDTVNTAVRIQGMCNKHQSQLLISGSLAQLLKLSLFTLKSLGSIPLRGKKESLEIFSVEKNKSVSNING